MVIRLAILAALLLAAYLVLRRDPPAELTIRWTDDYADGLFV